MSDILASADPYVLARTAAAAFAGRVGVDRHDVLVVLGSGWGDVAEALGEGPVIHAADLPGFPPTTAGGHSGLLRSIEVGGLHVLVQQGRVHLYEGHDPAVVVHGVRTAAALGCRVAILTNGAGSLRTDWAIGQPVLLKGQINMTARSPMVGPPPPAPLGGRFFDMTEPFSPRLRALARSVDPALPEGVYVGVLGPQFETADEIRAYARLGADLVGMSTVLEVIAARHLRMGVLGLSLATNLAAGLSDGTVDAQDVLDAGTVAAPRVTALLRAILQRLPAELSPERPA